MHTTRRALAALAATAVLAVSACGAGATGEEAAAPGDGQSWSFTDDLGRTVTLDERPDRVAGLTDAVVSLWNYGVEPVATFGYTGLASDERFEGKDVSEVTEVGRAYGEINLEALAAAKPDVIVTHVYATDSKGTIDADAAAYGFKDVAQQKAVEKIAPVVAIAMKGSATGVLSRTAELATALGAAPEKVAETKAAFEAASTRLRRAGERGVKVMAAAAYAEDGVYVARPQDDPALRYYTELGVDVLDLGGSEYYWTVVSWENIGKHEADLVLYSLRDAMDGAAMKKQPTFAATPAARADQLQPWVFASMDYPAMAAYMTDLAGYLESADIVT